jgi:hypothetical protein
MRVDLPFEILYQILDEYLRVYAYEDFKNLKDVAVLCKDFNNYFVKNRHIVKQQMLLATIEDYICGMVGELCEDYFQAADWDLQVIKSNSGLVDTGIILHVNAYEDDWVHAFSDYMLFSVNHKNYILVPHCVTMRAHSCNNSKRETQNQVFQIDKSHTKFYKDKSMGKY